MPLTKFSMLKGRAGSTRADFMRHWQTTHVDVLVNRARHKAYNRRYMQVEVVALPGLGDDTFDGIAQMIPRSRDVVQQGLQQDPLYAQYVRPDEELFLDVAACVVAYCESADFGAVDASGATFKAILMLRRRPGISSEEFEAGRQGRIHDMLAGRGVSCLLGIRQHRPIAGAVTHMRDGSLIHEAPDLIEELFFRSAAALHEFCASERFGASLECSGVLLPGNGSHVFAGLEHLVYEEA